MNYFDSMMTGELNQVTKNSRPSNELSDDDEPDLVRNDLLFSLILAPCFLVGWSA